MRRFVVAAQGLDKDSENNFIEYVKSNGFGWWHWIDNFWLLTTNNSTITAEDIQQNIDSGNGFNRNLVIEIEGSISWHGFGPAKTDNNMFEWIKNNWQ
jgi:hypothetical protein